MIMGLASGFSRALKRPKNILCRSLFKQKMKSRQDIERTDY